LLLRFSLPQLPQKYGALASVIPVKLEFQARIGEPETLLVSVPPKPMKAKVLRD